MPKQERSSLLPVRYLLHLHHVRAELIEIAARHVDTARRLHLVARLVLLDAVLGGGDEDPRLLESLPLPLPLAELVLVLLHLYGDEQAFDAAEDVGRAARGEVDHARNPLVRGQHLPAFDPHGVVPAQRQVLDDCRFQLFFTQRRGRDRAKGWQRR